MDSLTTRKARVAVVLAGALPYFADRTYIDLLGKNDRVIARTQARATMDPRGKVSFTPGHAKWDYRYSIGALKPDVVFQLWEKSDEARPILDTDYQPAMVQNHLWFFRRNSRAVKWGAVERLTKP
jgi:hypothetical protein